MQMQCCQMPKDKVHQLSSTSTKLPFFMKLVLFSHFQRSTYYEYEPPITLHVTLHYHIHIYIHSIPCLSQPLILQSFYVYKD